MKLAFFDNNLPLFDYILYEMDKLIKFFVKIKQKPVNYQDLYCLVCQLSLSVLSDQSHPNSNQTTKLIWKPKLPD